jgi:CIC family chloride channel protein
MTAAREMNRRPVAEGAAVQAPGRWRSFVRTSELGLVALAALVGVASGVVVVGLGAAAQLLHEFLYDLPRGQLLSSAEGLSPRNLLLAPVAGGLLLGILMAKGRLRRRTPVDPIEANALHGGRMSLTDSAAVALHNLISNGCGASVGLEAGYTQVSAGLASRLGLGFELRRGDLRMLVGCGAAAAIAAAFGAPLTGAFYAFELIVGTYTLASLAPVMVAALAGSLVARQFTGGAHVVHIAEAGPVATADYAPALALGLVCALLAILFMKSVTLAEGLARRSRVPPPLRPAVGGLCVGCLALVTPEVLSAGHGAFLATIEEPRAAEALALLIGLKAAASAVSIGSGFRGGLFFASLLLGALVGQLFAGLSPPAFPAATLGADTYAVVGMSAFAVAVIGGPLTMTMLALETTGEAGILGLVLVAVIASTLTVRKLFGYSFATWRFHLRGESIRSAHDIGWIRNLTVGQLMRRDVRTVRADSHLSSLLRAFPLGSTQRVVLVDEAERYAGIVLVAEAHAASLDEEESATRARDLARYQDDVLLPHLNPKEAAARFDAAESEALAVVDGRDTRRVIGLLTETHLLRRYSEELDRSRRDIAGET